MMLKTISRIFLAVLPVLTGCVMEDPCIHGEGPLTFVSFDLSAFTSVDLRGSVDVDVSYGDEQKVVVKGQENIISHLRTRVDGGTWQIGLDPGCFSDFSMTVYITLPQLERVALNGSGRVTVNTWKPGGEPLVVENNGSGSIELGDLKGKERLTVFVSGSGPVICMDTDSDLVRLDIYASGSGAFHGFGALSDTCRVVSTASGECEVFAGRKLFADLSGSGNVYYKGSPAIEASHTGSGRLLPRQ